ncbi:MAG: hypothetical protein FWC41_02370, partial [Firmicutes bacterium]|nr:hypothetical protein [Bacillota bacterium]
MIYTKTIVKLIESLLQNLDNKIIINDFVNIYDRDISSTNLAVSYAKEVLKTVIDELYIGKDEKDVFSNTLNKFKIKQTLLRNYANDFLLTNGSSICKKNFSVLQNIDIFCNAQEAQIKIPLHDSECSYKGHLVETK